MSVRIASLIALAALAPTALASTFTPAPFGPWMDRWQYPFAASAGTRAVAPTFTTLWTNNTGTQFDDRDAEFLLGFRTGPQTSPARPGIPTGFSPSRYTNITVTLNITADPSASWVYDPTQDAVRTYLNPGDPAANPPVAADPQRLPDADAGRPVELYAVGFRNGFTSATYLETSGFGAPPGSFRNTRHAFPIDFGGPANAARDVANNVSGAAGFFEVQPLAVATADLPPGSPVPAGTRFTFNVSTVDAPVRAYFQQALASGNLSLVVSSLHPSSAFGGGPITYPEWATRENLTAANRPTLTISATICIADIAGANQSPGADNQFTADDIIVFLGGYFANDLPTADVAGANQAFGPDGQLTADDIIVFLGAYFNQCG
ncbi:MAG: hypothetical protein MUE97_07270 [Phycisphaerales bacterium]|jgi:hypothetical protein|nr:hypothetical protein [Phycisphaerales bacterium]